MKKVKPIKGKKELPKKKKRISTKGLGEDQKEFIESKVKVFKTTKEVSNFYNRDDAVSTFAIKFAKSLKLPEV